MAQLRTRFTFKQPSELGFGIVTPIYIYGMPMTLIYTLHPTHRRVRIWHGDNCVIIDQHD